MSENHIQNAASKVCDDCIQIIELLSTEQYQFLDDKNSSIGSHFRHLIDFFQSLLKLAANDNPLINYDARQRDVRLTVDQHYARSKIQDIQKQIKALTDLNKTLQVHETLDADQAIVTPLSSSLGRELLFVCSHAVHHLSLIKLLAEKQNISIDANIGKAPSTIAYEKSESA